MSFVQFQGYQYLQKPRACVQLRNSARTDLHLNRELLLAHSQEVCKLQDFRQLLFATRGREECQG